VDLGAGTGFDPLLKENADAGWERVLNMRSIPRRTACEPLQLALGFINVLNEGEGRLTGMPLPLAMMNVRVACRESQ
jgi:hypothetical protein